MGATRSCPGFGTPLADKWSTGQDVGDVITYFSEAGATIELELNSRIDSMPFEGSYNTGSDEVTCGSNSVRQYIFDNNDVALQITLSQTQFEDPALEAAQSFDLSISPESLAGEPLAVGYVYTFALGLQARQRLTEEFVEDNFSENTGPEFSRFIENLQIGNNLYPYAVERMLTDPTPLSNAVNNTSPFATITRMIVAEDGGNGGGLVQFELLNGEVYSRI